MKSDRIYHFIFVLWVLSFFLVHKFPKMFMIAAAGSIVMGYYMASRVKAHKK